MLKISIFYNNNRETKEMRKRLIKMFPWIKFKFVHCRVYDNKEIKWALKQTNKKTNSLIIKNKDPLNEKEIAKYKLENKYDKRDMIKLMMEYQDKMDYAKNEIKQLRDKCLSIQAIIESGRN